MNKEAFIRQYRTTGNSAELLGIAYDAIMKGEAAAKSRLESMADPMNVARHAIYERYTKPRLHRGEGYTTYSALYKYAMRYGILDGKDEEIAEGWSKAWDEGILSLYETRQVWCYPEGHPLYGRQAREYPRETEIYFDEWMEQEYMR